MLPIVKYKKASVDDPFNVNSGRKNTRKNELS